MISGETLRLPCSFYWSYLGHLIPHPCWAFCNTLSLNKLYFQRLRLDFSSQLSCWCLCYFLNLRKREGIGGFMKRIDLFCSAITGKVLFFLLQKLKSFLLFHVTGNRQSRLFLSGASHFESPWTWAGCCEFVSLSVLFNAGGKKWMGKNNG